MPISIRIRIKFWFFEHYWWLLFLFGVAAIFVLLWRQQPLPTVVAVVGALLSLIYFLQKQKLEEMRLFREIFKECNARYDLMNEDLATIASLSPELSLQNRVKVVDYLNLCGEEYLYFKRGYIEPSVWEAWHNGMKFWTTAPAIHAVWEAEKQTGSYYDLPLDVEPDLSRFQKDAEDQD